MTTKKQRREAGIAKQARNREEARASGLRAQELDRQLRANKAILAEKARAKRGKEVIEAAQASRTRAQINQVKEAPAMSEDVKSTYEIPVRHQGFRVGYAIVGPEGEVVKFELDRITQSPDELYSKLKAHSIEALSLGRVLRTDNPFQPYLSFDE